MEMKFLISSFPRSGNKAKRGVEFCQSIKNASRIVEVSVLKLGEAKKIRIERLMMYMYVCIYGMSKYLRTA